MKSVIEPGPLTREAALKLQTLLLTELPDVSGRVTFDWSVRLTTLGREHCTGLRDTLLKTGDLCVSIELTISGVSVLEKFLFFGVWNRVISDDGCSFKKLKPEFFLANIVGQVCSRPLDNPVSEVNDLMIGRYGSDWRKGAFI